MRAIDADALIEVINHHCYPVQHDMTSIEPGMTRIGILQAIQEQPTIEPRCETCEAFNKTRLLIPQPQHKKGMWIEHNPHKWGLGIVFECSECGEKIDCEPSNFCPNCGADMRTPVDIAKDIVHKIIDNTAWSDAVDTAKMHKIVDDKYAEIRGDANVDAES